MRDHDLTEVLDRAKSYLLRQAESGFPGTSHRMVFPRFAGFTVSQDEQSSDVFVRAALGSLLSEISSLEEDDPAFCSRLAEIGRAEAAYVASARLPHREGGWSYFPGLPELPPDLDSLAAALLLFTRWAPEHAALCEGPVRIALDQRGAEGSLRTWIISPGDAPEQRELMERGVSQHWGDSADVEVCAQFYRALWAYDRQRFAPVVRAGAEWVRSRQQPDGSWEATWYWGNVYGTSLCIQLLEEVASGDEAAARGVAFLARSQRENGGWGLWESVPLDTAVALWALGRPPGKGPREAIARGVENLFNYQTLEGYWNATPWIQMDTGRTGRGPGRVATFGSATLTTAFCLRALLLARKIL